jgi:hypothetical protein
MRSQAKLKRAGRSAVGFIYHSTRVSALLAESPLIAVDVEPSNDA